MSAHRRYAAEQKALLLETVRRDQLHSDEPLQDVLSQLGLPWATYHRWQSRAEEDRLTDRHVAPRPGTTRRLVLPTPAEAEAVCAFALGHPAMGYKRLAWLMVDQDVAYFRPYQVYGILDDKNLLHRQPKTTLEGLKRPADPDHADQVWHIDLMYLYVRPRWYYLVDILDGYSRYLVNWSLNLTMTTDTVTMTVQAALEKLSGRRQGEPKVVHDHGSQFLSREWRTFIEAVGVTDIKTRVAHPESNGRLERLHRTHREEGLVGEAKNDYYQAVDCMKKWAGYYNEERPHSALNYLRPVDYYRGDPQARLEEREEKLRQALLSRHEYWQGYSDVKEPGDLSLN